MLLSICRAKIHRATVTATDLHYEGSITIDRRLLDASGILPWERVQIVNVMNGSRIETYVISGKPGSGVVCLNGAAARLIHKGDRVIISAFVSVPDSEAAGYHPKIVFVDDRNRPEMIEDHLTADDFC